jgi:sulfur transfer complex TusBCD TusB component (DsrH family)
VCLKGEKTVLDELTEQYKKVYLLDSTSDQMLLNKSVEVLIKSNNCIANSDENTIKVYIDFIELLARSLSG